MWTLSKRSRSNLAGVHCDLVRVVKRAIHISAIDFMVIEGRRTEEHQQRLMRHGAGVLNSRHLTGHAVDCVPLINGSVTWNDRSLFKLVAEAMLHAAQELEISLRWGGDWNENGNSDNERFYDGAHFELRWQEYPA